MSIEQALAENTSAIRELIAAIRAGVPTTPAQGAAVVAEAPERAAETPAKSDAAEHGKTAAQATDALQGHANAPEQTATFEEAKAAVIRISKEKGRDAAVAVLAKFNVAKLPELKPEHYGALISAVTEALA